MLTETCGKEYQQSLVRIIIEYKQNSVRKQTAQKKETSAC